MFAKYQIKQRPIDICLATDLVPFNRISHSKKAVMFFQIRINTEIEILVFRSTKIRIRITYSYTLQIIKEIVAVPLLCRSLPSNSIDKNKIKNCITVSAI